jgi:hypothetical protein
VTVTDCPPNGSRVKNYWELKDCQPGGANPPQPQPVRTPTPRPTPAPLVGCADPRTIGFMDEWLTRAVPVPAGNYRFDQFNQPVDPYTWATRCQYLWSIAPSMNSRNLGTMLDYVRRRLAGR